MTIAESILMKKDLGRDDLVYLLLTRDETERMRLFSQAKMAKVEMALKEIHRNFSSAILTGKNGNSDALRE